MMVLLKKEKRIRDGNVGSKLFSLLSDVLPLNPEQKSSIDSLKRHRSQQGDGFDDVTGGAPRQP